MNEPVRYYRRNCLWQALGEHHCSLSWLSRTLPYDLGALSRMANHRQTVTATLAERIAAVLGEPVAELFSEPRYLVARPTPRPRRAALTIPELFWLHATPGAPDACWEWRGSYSGRSPIITYRNADSRRTTSTSARRVAWQIGRTEAIPDGQWVLSGCGNLNCVNPAHLTTASPSINIDYMRQYRRRVAASDPHYHEREAAWVRASRARRRAETQTHAGG